MNCALKITYLLIYTPVAQCCYVTMYWLLQSISVNSVRGGLAAAINAIMPPFSTTTTISITCIKLIKIHLTRSIFLVIKFHKNHFQLTLDYLVHVPRCTLHGPRPLHELTMLSKAPSGEEGDVPRHLDLWRFSPWISLDENSVWVNGCTIHCVHCIRDLLKN